MDTRGLGKPLPLKNTECEFVSWARRTERRVHKRWDPLTTGRARGLLREIFSPGRAKMGELQGSAERLGDLMRHYTQTRLGTASDTRLQRTSGWRRWEHFFPKNSSDTAKSNGHGRTRTSN